MYYTFFSIVNSLDVRLIWKHRLFSNERIKSRRRRNPRDVRVEWDPSQLRRRVSLLIAGHFSSHVHCVLWFPSKLYVFRRPNEITGVTTPCAFLDMTFSKWPSLKLQSLSIMSAAVKYRKSHVIRIEHGEIHVGCVRNVTSRNSYLLIVFSVIVLRSFGFRVRSRLSTTALIFNRHTSTPFVWEKCRRSRNYANNDDSDSTFYARIVG